MTTKRKTTKETELTTFTDRDAKTLGRIISKLIGEACTDKKKLALLKGYHKLLSTGIDEIENE